MVRRSPPGMGRVPKIRLILVLLGFVSVWLCLPMTGLISDGFTKPLPPVVYAWDRQVKGDRLYLVLHVTATARLSHLAVQVGGGLSPQGQTTWQGPLKVGEKTSLILWVPLDAKGAVDARVDGAGRGGRNRRFVIEGAVACDRSGYT